MRRHLLGLALVVGPACAAAQGVRVTGVTAVQGIELRPLVYDSIAPYFTVGAGEWRLTPDGTPARCLPNADYCVFQRSGDRIQAAPLLQDLSFSAWGIGEGVSVHVDLRGRTQLTTQGLIYPRSDTHFEVMDAYADVDRPWGRARLGRQWIAGGLGVYNFDGANLVYRRSRYSVEGWAGRALEAGLNVGYSSAELAAIENLPPDQNGYIVGVRGRMRPNAVTSATATYQRVLVADRSGLYSERAAFDATTRAYGVSLDMALAYDFASGAWNEARLRLGRAGLHTLGVSVEARHSAPFFETWTIWGAFSPVAFNEARATLDWRPGSVPVMLSAHGAYRRYNESDAGFTLRSNGWRAGASALLTGSSEFSGHASYDVDIGDGASRNDARVSVRWNPSTERSLGITGSALQNIYEFKIGTGRVMGLALDAATPITSDIRLMADVGFYRQLFSQGAPGPDWTQRRAALRLEWTLGRDPGQMGKAQ